MQTIVGKRFFEKTPEELFIGSSVVLGNGENVKVKNSKEKGKLFEKPIYIPLDNLELIEAYKSLIVKSSVDENVIYEILYDALENEIKGILCGVREEGMISYYALVSGETKSIKKSISFYIDYVEIASLEAIRKEVEELLKLDIEGIKERYKDNIFSERVYAGTFIGDNKTDNNVIAIVPFSVYKANEVIPAFVGEEDENIARLEIELEEVSLKIAELEDIGSEEYKQLQKRRIELMGELSRLKRKLYNPDILKAIKDAKNQTKFIAKKTEIRYLGENLIQTAYLYKDLKMGNSDRIKGVYAVLTLPVYNNLSKQLQRSYLELFLCLYTGNEIFPVELQKARQTVVIMDEVLRELIKSVEAGIKPSLTVVKERIKDNLSLRKRVDDLEKFVISKVEEDNTEEVLSLLKKLKEETEYGRRIVYSIFASPYLISTNDILPILQEEGMDVGGLSKEGWQELFKLIETTQDQIRTILKESLDKHLNTIVEYLLRKLRDGKIVYRGRKGIEEYPNGGRRLEIVDFQPNKVFQAIVQTLLRKINKEELIKDIEEFEIYFLNYAIPLKPFALKLITRFILLEAVKEYLHRVEGKKERLKKLRERLIETYKGKYQERKVAGATGLEILEIEDIPDFLTENEAGEKEEDIDLEL